MHATDLQEGEPAVQPSEIELSSFALWRNWHAEPALRALSPDVICMLAQQHLPVAQPVNTTYRGCLVFRTVAGRLEAFMATWRTTAVDRSTRRRRTDSGGVIRERANEPDANDMPTFSLLPHLTSHLLALVLDGVGRDDGLRLALASKVFCC